MDSKAILAEIKKLSLKEQAKVIKAVERYREEILEELGAKPESPFVFPIKEYVPYPVYPAWPRVNPWNDRVICTSTTSGGGSTPQPKLGMSEKREVLDILSS
jgi:hypothetical protein